MSTIEVGELLYEYTVKFTDITEYGVSLESLIAGTVDPPREGASFDVAFEGTSRGPKLKGKVTGVDYLRVRADGRFELHIHARITAEDGQKIALFIDGTALPRKGSSIADLRENVTLSTSAKDYTWVNTLQVWGIGTVDLVEQVVQLKAYST